MNINRPTSFLELLHYSRFPLIVTSGLLATTNSSVLIGSFAWQPTVIVMLGTYIVYTIDNLIDWSREREILSHIESVYICYRNISIVFMLVASVAIILLSLNRGVQFALTLMIFYLISLGIIIVSRVTKLFTPDTTYYWVERLVVALSWSLITLAVPLQYADAEYDITALLTFVYVWQIAWVIGVIWRYSTVVNLVQINGEMSDEKVNVEILKTKRLVQILQIVCIIAATQATVDILLGFFPVHNSIVLTVPIVELVFLKYWRRIYSHPLVYCNGFLALINVLMLSIITFHLK